MGRVFEPGLMPGFVFFYDRVSARRFQAAAMHTISNPNIIAAKT